MIEPWRSTLVVFGVKVDEEPQLLKKNEDRNRNVLYIQKVK